MRYFTPKEAAEKTGYKIDMINRGILRGKKKPGTGIASIEDVNSDALIPESEVDRLLCEKAIFESDKYFSGRDLEAMGYSRELLRDGTLETVKACGMYFVYFEEFKKYIENDEKNYKELPKKCCEKKAYVHNVTGIDFLMSSYICRACANHYEKSRTECTIIYKKKKWKYPDVRHREAGYLFFMRIPSGAEILIETYGTQAEMLMDLLIRKI